MINLLIQIFLISLIVNLIYEFCHSWLYETCRRADLRKCMYLIIKGGIFDAVVITLFYYATYILFGSQNIFENNLQLTVFIILSLALAYFWEKYSLRKKKWEYAKEMPLLFGVGLTPFVQLALTGILTFYIVFNLI